jgi:hypothetical protein
MEQQVVQEFNAESGKWDVMPPEAPVEAKPAVEPPADVDDPPSKATPAVEAKAVPDAKVAKPRNDPQARIDQVIAKQKDAERRLADAERRAEDAERRAAATKEPVTEPAKAAATSDDFPSLTRWLEQHPESANSDDPLRDYNRAFYTHMRNEERKQEADAKQSAHVEQTFATKVHTFSTKYADAITADPDRESRIDKGLLQVRPYSLMTAADKAIIRNLARSRRNSPTISRSTAPRLVRLSVSVSRSVSPPPRVRRSSSRVFRCDREHHDHGSGEHRVRLVVLLGCARDSGHGGPLHSAGGDPARQHARRRRPLACLSGRVLGRRHARHGAERQQHVSERRGSSDQLRVSVGTAQGGDQFAHARLDREREPLAVQPGAAISELWKEAMFSGPALSWDQWYEDVNVFPHVTGAQGGTPTVNGAGQTGSSLVTQAWSNSITGILKKGDVFTIGTGATGVFAVNPQNYRSTTQLQQFVVTADCTSSGAGALTIPIYPPIVTSGAYQTVVAAPGNTAAITVLGAASTTTPQGLGFHPSAFVMASADLPEPKQGEFKRVRMPGVGMALRYWESSDIMTDSHPSRLDMIYGFKTQRPEFAVRFAS